MLESYLIKHCSPTLASLKSGSLFSCKCTSDDEIERTVADWNEKLSERGISIRLMRRTDRGALIYVYRKSALKNALDDPDIRDYLHTCGYDACYICDDCTSHSCSVENCLSHLESRIKQSEHQFPHEIGLFLGYPLTDVVGFV